MNASTGERLGLRKIQTRENMFSARPTKSNPTVAKPTVVILAEGRVSRPPIGVKNVSDDVNNQEVPEEFGITR